MTKPEDGDEVVVGRGYNRSNVLDVVGFVLGIKEVINHTPGDDALPMFLQKDISSIID